MINYSSWGARFIHVLCEL